MALRGIVFSVGSVWLPQGRKLYSVGNNEGDDDGRHVDFARGVEIVSGEGDGEGTTEDYEGKPTADALRRRNRRLGGAVMKKNRTNLTVRLSPAERELLTQLRELFHLETDSQTLRKIIRDTSTELGVR